MLQLRVLNSFRDIWQQTLIWVAPDPPCAAARPARAGPSSSDHALHAHILGVGGGVGEVYTLCVSCKTPEANFEVTLNSL